MKCPKGCGDLQKGIFANLPIESCKICEGTWLSLRKNTALEALLTAEGAGTLMQGSPALPVKENPVRCPGCRGALKGIQHNAAELDLCERCGGIWFDRGELLKTLLTYDSFLAFLRSADVPSQVQIPTEKGNGASQGAEFRLTAVEKILVGLVLLSVVVLLVGIMLDQVGRTIFDLVG